MGWDWKSEIMTFHACPNLSGFLRHLQLRLKFQNTLRVPPSRPHSNGMEEPPKCTILRFRCQNFPPQTPPTGGCTPPPEPTTLWFEHGAMRRANTLFAPRKSKFAPSIFNLDNLDYCIKSCVLTTLGRGVAPIARHNRLRSHFDISRTTRSLYLLQ